MLGSDSGRIGGQGIAPNWDTDAGSHEAKFVLASMDVPRIQGLMNERLVPDGQYPCARITSLYYDTPDLRFVSDKENSDFYKCKVRLRWYSDPDTGGVEPDAFFEVKAKRGAIRQKSRCKLEGQAPYLATLDLHEPALAKLPRELCAPGPLLPPVLEPFVVVSYLRRRYILPRTQTRISLDWNIEARAAHPRFGPSPSRPLNQAVVELKGNLRILPPELRELTSLGARLGTFSKYGRCADIVLGERTF